MADADPAGGRARSVDMPRAARHGEATLQTATFDSPVEGAAHLVRLGASRWRDHLRSMDEIGRPPEPGELGENPTVDGLGEAIVRSDDRGRIGAALAEAGSPRMAATG